MSYNAYIPTPPRAERYADKTLTTHGKCPDCGFHRVLPEQGCTLCRQKAKIKAGAVAEVEEGSELREECEQLVAAMEGREWVPTTKRRAIREEQRMSMEFDSASGHRIVFTKHALERLKSRCGGDVAEQVGGMRRFKDRRGSFKPGSLLWANRKTGAVLVCTQLASGKFLAVTALAAGDPELVLGRTKPRRGYRATRS